MLSSEWTFGMLSLTCRRLRTSVIWIRGTYSYKVIAIFATVSVGWRALCGADGCSQNLCPSTRLAWRSWRAMNNSDGNGENQDARKAQQHSLHFKTSNLMNFTGINSSIMGTRVSPGMKNSTYDAPHKVHPSVNSSETSVRSRVYSHIRLQLRCTSVFCWNSTKKCVESLTIWFWYSKTRINRMALLALQCQKQFSMAMNALLHTWVLSLSVYQHDL
jgi:hypothetical protein